MLKNILNLDGAQKLNKNEQKAINGGINDSYENYRPCTSGSYHVPYCCLNGVHSLCGWG